MPVAVSDSRIWCEALGKPLACRAAGVRRLNHLRDNVAAAAIMLNDTERSTLAALLEHTPVMGERYGANVAAYNRPKH